MPSYYSVVQFAPDPISGERVNFGVITYGDGGVHCRFVDDWRRVRTFAGGKDIRFLQQIAHDVEAATGEQPHLPMQDGRPALTDDVVRAWAGNWLSNLQLTRPRGSVLTSEELLDSIYGDYVREPAKATRRARSRRTAAKFVADTLQQVLRSQGGPCAEQLVQRNKPVQGAVEPHRYDVVVDTDGVHFGAQALSFEGADEVQLTQDVRLTAWDISDVRVRLPDLQLAVVALPPNRDSGAYKLAHKVASEHKATLVVEEEFRQWAHERSRQWPLPANLPQPVGR